MSDIQFVDGMIVKRPENAPDYLLAKLSLKRDEHIAWLQQQNQWINIELKRSKAGKCYAAVDQWKPNKDEIIPTTHETAKSNGYAPDLDDRSEIPF